MSGLSRGIFFEDNWSFGGFSSDWANRKRTLLCEKSLFLGFSFGRRFFFRSEEEEYGAENDHSATNRPSHLEAPIVDPHEDRKFHSDEVEDDRSDSEDSEVYTDFFHGVLRGRSSRSGLGPGG